MKVKEESEKAEFNIQKMKILTSGPITSWQIDGETIGKGVHQGCIVSPCLLTYLLTVYAEYIMKNAGLDETQVGIKIVGRNVNNLRYVDDTSLMAESEE